MKNAEVIDVLIDPFLFFLIPGVQIDLLLFPMHQINKKKFVLVLGTNI